MYSDKDIKQNSIWISQLIWIVISSLIISISISTEVIDTFNEILQNNSNVKGETSLDIHFSHNQIMYCPSDLYIAGMISLLPEKKEEEKKEQSELFYYLLGILILIIAAVILRQRYKQYLEEKNKFSR